MMDFPLDPSNCKEFLKHLQASIRYQVFITLLCVLFLNELLKHLK